MFRNKILVQFILIIIGIFIFFLPKIRGYWFELSAKRITENDIKSSILSFEEQQKQIIILNYKICEFQKLCTDNTSESCALAAQKISKIEISKNLPPNVVSNLKIFQSSMVNSYSKISDSWRASEGLSSGRTRNKGGVIPFFKYWEVDTCGVGSINQKINRLYKLDSVTGSKIITCEDFQNLYSSQKKAPL